MADRRLAVYLDGTPVDTLVQNGNGRLGCAYLAGLLPDSEPTLERWGREYGTSPRNPFALLAHVGMDAAGAVQVLPEGTCACGRLV